MGQITLTKERSMKSHQRLLKRKSVVLFFKSHPPAGLRSMGDFLFFSVLTRFVREGSYHIYLEERAL